MSAPRWMLVLVAIVAAGCPGQRRPDPRWASRTPAPSTPVAEPPPPVAPLTGTAGLVAAREEVARLEQRFAAAPSDRAAWQALIEAIGRAENVAQAMSEGSGPESEAGYDALEELGRVRSDVVQREPR